MCAMGIVSDDEFEKEISRISPTCAPEIITIEKGRGEGNKAVPESLRKIIGETGELDGRQEALALAKMFDISDSSVSAYTNGATSTASYDKPNAELKGHIDNTKERISKKARSRLFSALKHITEDKLAEAKLRDVSSVARDMAAIVKDMESESSGKDSGQNKPQFIFYAPTFRKEETFETIYVRE